MLTLSNSISNKHKKLLNIAIHTALVAVAYYFAFLLRFEFRLPADEQERLLYSLPFYLLINLSVFAYFHLYEGLWRYVSMRDILAILKAGTASTIIFSAGVLIVIGDGFPRSVLLLNWLLCLALVGGIRLAIRAVREARLRYRQERGKRAFIIGAGDAGEMLMREITRNLSLNYYVAGFIDDDVKKHGRRIHGIEVIGGTYDLPRLRKEFQIEELLVALPSVEPTHRMRIIELCQTTGVPFKSVPAINELLQGRARIGQLQEVKPEDLLSRDAVRLDRRLLRAELCGKRIIVTGAGGSIGSELCRQLATFDPDMLVLLDQAESSLYWICIELQRLYPSVKIIPHVGDILNRNQIEEVIGNYRPDIFYHAAAYKHVPLMEDQPIEALENNIFGTEIVARAARKGNVKKFVFVSTDKAVKPVGIMGMTKRIAECLLLSLNGGTTSFLVVRFGNVLGSDGSVLPLFQSQIARGGPVTVTDPEASRYFMLLSEAAQLVLQAGAIGKDGEIFFLDMGQPLKIVDFAQNLIRLSGYEPGNEIKIKMTGLRPGERLTEELVMDKEDLVVSEHEKVFKVRNHGFDRNSFLEDLERLRPLTASRDREGAVAHLRSMTGRY